MRPERLYLLDIVEAAAALSRFLEAWSEARFLEDEVMQAAVLHELAVIGEAAARLGADVWARYPRVPWPVIVGLRNVIVHEYFGISWPTIWLTATGDVPVLREQIASILAAEFPDETSA